METFSQDDVADNEKWAGTNLEELMEHIDNVDHYESVIEES